MAANSIGRDIHLVRAAQVAGEAFGHHAFQDRPDIRSAASLRALSIVIMLFAMCVVAAAYLVP
jgi:hypothetical protein